MPEEQYKEGRHGKALILELQSLYPKCLGCGATKNGGRERFDIDHDAKTGFIRGMLCNPCNIALGLCRDNPQTLRNLADYLEGKGRYESLPSLKPVPHNPDDPLDVAVKEWLDAYLG